MAKTHDHSVMVGQQLPRHDAFNSGDAANSKLADNVVVDQNGKPLDWQLVLPDKGTELENHQVASGDPWLRQFEGAFDAARPCVLRFGGRPAGPTKLTGVSAEAEIDH